MKIQIVRKIVFVMVAIAAMALAYLLFPASRTLAANPATINFQGKIVNSNGTNITDGTYSVVFRIYNTSNPTMTTSCTSTATCLWEETQGSVSVTNSIFQVELGSSCALTSSSCNNSTGGPINYASTSSLYLTMQFNGDTSGTRGGFMYPLIHMNSVPFALQADNAGQLGGLSSSNFVQLAQGVQAETSTTNPSIFINKNNASGSPNILQLQKAGVNVAVVDNSGTLLLGQANTGGLNGKLTFNNSTNTNTVSINGSAVTSTYMISLPSGTSGGANYCLVGTDSSGTTSTSWTPCGSGSTATITLSPEYPGAVMTHNNNSANGGTGTMTSDFCSGSSHLGIPASSNPCSATQDFNYYSWTANATNDYDIWTQWQVPTDFSSISSITFYGWTTSTSDAVKLTVYNAGTACGNSTISATSSGFSSTTVSTASCSGGSAIAAGSNVIFDADLKVGVNSEFARVSRIVIVYNRK